MEVKANLELDKSEITELSKILVCKEGELTERLTPFASAAVAEMVSMFLGQKVFIRGSDILEYRLFLLIVYAFGGKIPDEQDVCRLFQETASGSRSLIRAVMSKYQYQLKDIVEKSLRTLLDNVIPSKDDDCFTVSVHSLNLVEELNSELAAIDTNLPPVEKKRGSVSTYKILPSSYERLCKRFKVIPKQLDASKEKK